MVVNLFGKAKQKDKKKLNKINKTEIWQKDCMMGMEGLGWGENRFKIFENELVIRMVPPPPHTHTHTAPQYEVLSLRKLNFKCYFPNFWKFWAKRIKTQRNIRLPAKKME